MSDKILRKQLSDKDKEVQELLVLIDTLQCNLRSCVSCLPEQKKKEINSVKSFQWSLNWKPNQK
jgi:hypothetical protein